MQTALHHGRRFWLWGDTTLARYPLGIFHSTAAFTAPQPLVSFEPPVHLRFDFVTDQQGAPRPVARMPGDSPLWISACVSLPDNTGTMRLVASQANSPILLFEGTYTSQFADRPVPIPRYDYNQILYRLDLDDPRLASAQGRQATRLRTVRRPGRRRRFPRGLRQLGQCRVHPTSPR